MPTAVNRKTAIGPDSPYAQVTQDPLEPENARLTSLASGLHGLGKYPVFDGCGSAQGGS
jgi:hypothetical protein